MGVFACGNGRAEQARRQTLASALYRSLAKPQVDPGPVRQNLLCSRLLSDHNELMLTFGAPGDLSQPALFTEQQLPRLSERFPSELGHNTRG